MLNTSLILMGKDCRTHQQSWCHCLLSASHTVSTQGLCTCKVCCAAIKTLPPHPPHTSPPSLSLVKCTASFPSYQAQMQSKLDYKIPTQKIFYFVIIFCFQTCGMIVATKKDYLKYLILKYEILNERFYFFHL